MAIATVLLFLLTAAAEKKHPGLLSTTNMYCTPTVKNFLCTVSQGDPLNKIFEKFF
jgi:hypothetical protein